MKPPAADPTIRYKVNTINKACDEESFTISGLLIIIFYSPTAEAASGSRPLLTAAVQQMEKLREDRAL